MISDRFGDLTLEEVIPHYERWAHKLANDMQGVNSPDHDDLVQEARIAIWHALKKYDDTQGALPTYVTRAARWRMNDAHQRQHWTGQPTKQGSKTSDRFRVDASLDWFMEEGITGLLEAVDLLDGVELAYHHGQIAEAINSLPDLQRRYVVLRFWGGLTGAEINARLDPPASLEAQWRNSMRAKLRDHLLHLG